MKLLTRIRNVHPWEPVTLGHGPDGITAAAVTMQGWEAVAMLLDQPADDGRLFLASGAGWRTPPLTLLYQPTLDEGHDGAFPVGRVDRVWLDGKKVMMSGVYLDSEDAQDVYQLVEDGTVRGVSVDLAIKKVIVPEPEMGDEAPPDAEVEIDVTAEAPTFSEFDIMSLTILPQQAFSDANIYNLSPGSTPSGDQGDGVTASAAGLAPLRPPLEWFSDPVLPGPTPLTITDQGQVYGHLATWGQCHVGVPGRCLPPESLSGTTSSHSYFHKGEVITAEGERVQIGTLTFSEQPDLPGHASQFATATGAVAHYDNTATVVADLRVGNDEHGIWMAGALRPELPVEKLRAIMASVPSGDWRPISGGYELVHAHLVNEGGYPVPRAILSEDAEGEVEVLAVVAAGVPLHLYPAAVRAERAPFTTKALAVRAVGGLEGLVEAAKG